MQGLGSGADAFLQTEPNCPQGARAKIVACDLTLASCPPRPRRHRRTAPGPDDAWQARAQRWRAYVVDDPDEPEPTDGVLYCPRCGERASSGRSDVGPRRAGSTGLDLTNVSWRHNGQRGTRHAFLSRRCSNPRAARGAKTALAALRGSSDANERDFWWVWWLFLSVNRRVHPPLGNRQVCESPGRGEQLPRPLDHQAVGRRGRRWRERPKPHALIERERPLPAGEGVPRRRNSPLIWPLEDRNRTSCVIDRPGTDPCASLLPRPGHLHPLRDYEARQSLPSPSTSLAVATLLRGRDCRNAHPVHRAAQNVPGCG